MLADYYGVRCCGAHLQRQLVQLQGRLLRAQRQVALLQVLELRRDPPPPLFPRLLCYVRCARRRRVRWLRSAGCSAACGLSGCCSSRLCCRSW